MADTRAIVSDTNSNVIFVVDLTTQTILATLSAGISTPGPIAVLPNATEAYATNNAGIPGNLFPVNLPAYTSGTTIVVGNQPEGIVASPNGSHVYTANRAGTVTPVATPSNVAGGGIALGVASVQSLAVDPAGAMLYVTTFGSGIVPVAIPSNVVGAAWGSGPLTSPDGIVVMPDSIHGYTGSQTTTNIWPLNLVTQTVGSPIVTTGNPNFLFLQPGGSQIWAPDPGTNQVMVISTVTNTQTHTITLTGGGVPTSGGFDSAGTTFYACTPGTGDIFAIDTSTYALGSTYNITGTPRFIAVVPVPAPPPTPPYPGGQFIPKLFIPQKGKRTQPYTADELRANWMTIEVWSQRWLPPPTVALSFPRKYTPDAESVNANWITLETWAGLIHNLGAPYSPIVVPRKDSINPTDLDIDFLRVENWANRLPL